MITDASQIPDWYKIQVYDQMRELLEQLLPDQLLHTSETEEQGTTVQVCGWGIEPGATIGILAGFGETHPPLRVRIPLPLSLSGTPWMVDDAPFQIDPDGTVTPGSTAMLDLGMTEAARLLADRVDQSISDLQQAATLIRQIHSRTGASTT